MVDFTLSFDKYHIYSATLCSRYCTKAGSEIWLKYIYIYILLSKIVAGTAGKSLGGILRYEPVWFMVLLFSSLSARCYKREMCQGYKKRSSWPEAGGSMLLSFQSHTPHTHVPRLLHSHHFHSHRTAERQARLEVLKVGRWKPYLQAVYAREAERARYEMDAPCIVTPQASWPKLQALKEQSAS